MIPEAEYDFTKLKIERAQASSSVVGSLVLGVSLLGASVPGGGGTGGWTPIEFSSFNMNGSYEPNDDKVLIFNTISGSITRTYWEDPGNDPDVLRPTDKLRISYDDDWEWLAVVESVTQDTYFDHKSRSMGGTTRTDVTAVLIDYYVAMLREPRCWLFLPSTTWINRIRSVGITVNGWTG